MPAQSDMMCVHGQSCLTLCNSMDCSPPGSSVHEIFQARILEWLSFPSPGNLPDPGIKATFRVSPALASGFFTTAPPGTNTEFPIWHHSPGAVINLVAGWLLWTTPIMEGPVFCPYWNRYLLWMQICISCMQCFCQNYHLGTHRIPYSPS